MKESKRKFFRRWPIRSIEYIFKFSPLWVIFEWWWHEDNEVYVRLWLLFCTLYIIFNIKVKTVFISWNTETKDFEIKHKQRSFWFIISNDCLMVWYGKPWQWIECETTKSFYYYRLRDKLFWEPKYSKEELDWREFEIYIPDMYDETKVNLHKYKYRHIISKRKYLTHTKTRKYTDIEVIWDAPRIPWKWTCSYNCWDDSILWCSIEWHKDIEDIKRKIVWDVYYYRSYYPL
jgi:hypothetical protein